MHQAFLESTHTEVTKNPYYVLPRKWSEKKISAQGLVGHCAHSCWPPDGTKQFSKKRMKRDDNYIYVVAFLRKIHVL